MVLYRTWSRVRTALLLGLAGLPTTAANAAPVDQVVPYTGNLDRDGAPVSGQVALRFRVFTDQNAAAPDPDPCDGAATPGAEQCVWAEVHPEVQVHNGAFVVRLGRPTGAGAERRDVAPLFRQNQHYYLEVAVSDEVAGRWVVLGRQSLHPVPQAIFQLQDDLNVNSLRANTAAIGRVHVTQDGTADALRIGTGGFDTPSPYQLHLGSRAVSAQLTWAGGATLPDTLYLNPDGGPIEIGSSVVNINGELRFGGAEPFNGIELRSFNHFSGFDEFEDMNLGVRHNNGRSVCFLQTMAIGNAGRLTEEVCELVRSGDGNYHLISRGRADRAVRCAAGCMFW